MPLGVFRWIGYPVFGLVCRRHIPNLPIGLRIASYWLVLALATLLIDIRLRVHCRLIPHRGHPSHRDRLVVLMRCLPRFRLHPLYIVHSQRPFVVYEVFRCGSLLKIDLQTRTDEMLVIITHLHIRFEEVLNRRSSYLLEKNALYLLLPR
jgi:hypothetical protein